jgi:hypothetical protein
MEQQHPHQGGEYQDPQFHEQHQGTPESVTDADLIHYNITEALREERPIDNATARVIASQLHGGQASPLYALASSGALVDGLRDELDGWRREDTPVELEPWLDALDEYLDSRRDEPGAVEGWSELWPTPPPGREDDEPDTGEEERPLYGSTRDLGRMASGAVYDQARDAEPTKATAGGLPALPARYDCDGYEWMERLPEGWNATPSWGRDGWDLGQWPYCIVVAY